MKHFALPPLTHSSERENKITILLLISVFSVLVVANGLARVNIVEWSEVERVAVYDEYAILGSSVAIEYYLVNDRPYEIKVKPLQSFSISYSYSSDSSDREKVHVHSETPSERYITIPANDEVFHSSETFNITKSGLLYMKKTTFPDVTINILDVKTPVTQFNVTVGLNGLEFTNQDIAKLVIINADSHDITYGSPYIIEIQIEGEWVEVSPFPSPFAWTAELRICPVGETTTQKIKIDTLESGHYRVSKLINHERTKTELTFRLEFNIVMKADDGA